MEGTTGLTHASGEVESTRTGFTAYCPHCRHEALFTHMHVANRRHLVLSIVTGGLWLVVWFAVLLGRVLRPWRCTACGWHKPEFRKMRTG
jgi:hypothetical protein